jgi:hypothetical protein
MNPVRSHIITTSLLLLVTVPALASDDAWSEVNAWGPTECEGADRQTGPSGWTCTKNAWQSLRYFADTERCEADGPQKRSARVENSVTGVSKEQVLATFSCKKGVEDGVRIEYAYNGKLQSKKTFKDGVQLGPYETYNAAGKLLERSALCLKKDGSGSTERCGAGVVNTYWEDTGTLKDSFNFTGEMMSGQQQGWHPNGKLAYSGKYCPFPGDPNQFAACGVWTYLPLDPAAEPTVKHCYVSTPLGADQLRLPDDVPFRCPPPDGEVTLEESRPIPGESPNATRRWTGTMKRGVPVGPWTTGSDAVCLDARGQVSEDGAACAPREEASPPPERRSSPARPTVESCTPEDEERALGTGKSCLEFKRAVACMTSRGFTRGCIDYLEDGDQDRYEACLSAARSCGAE